MSKISDKIKGGLIGFRNYIVANPVKSILAIVGILTFVFCLPNPLFHKPYATVVEDKNGELLGAKIASDGQWRFPQSENIPEKFKICLLQFEDEYFYWHPGINPIAIAKAAYSNVKAQKVVRGGSTLSQQVIRLSRENKTRSALEKLWETVLSVRLELSYSKDEIVTLYAAHAPFGGNVVGLEMASWRYFGVASDRLSWAQSATLAVLPNAPGLIYPGRNQEPLLKKRNRLLQKLHHNGILDAMEYELALLEPLPQKPYDLPQLAPHLVERAAREYPMQRIVSTLDIDLQEQINRIVAQYYQRYQQNQVHNLAVLVLDVETRNIVSYVGNSPTDNEHQKDVDLIIAPRSTGSLLKPLLLAEMMDEGLVLPDALLPDIPVQISGFMPENFDQKFDGAVLASEALSRSLNIPFVLLLQEFGVPKFYRSLREYGLKNINRHPDQYGLSLILGGAESNLWDLCRTYAGWSGTLNYYALSQGRFRTQEFHELNYHSKQKADFGTSRFEKNRVGAGAIWSALKAMEEVNRPTEDQAWKFYDSAQEIAWKTGTSFGNRDAWAIGLTSKYVVGVWVGNATGEGRPELTGVNYAAPVVFEVFQRLPKSPKFPKPLNDLVEVEVCSISGHLASQLCPTQKKWVPLKGQQSKMCPFHIRIHVDTNTGERVTADCSTNENRIARSHFVLPPVQEYYYKSLHTEYQPLPRLKDGCQGEEQKDMDFIYPKTLTPKIFLTRDFNGRIQPLVVKVAHKQENARLFWYVNGQFMGKTEHFHEFALDLSPGKHRITVVDQRGSEIWKEVHIERN